jgi:hypothetical protein
LPGKEYLDKLIERNEHFICSNHPIKNQLISQLGRTPNIRKKFVYKVYENAKLAIPYTWHGIKGYNPATDPFYKSFVSSLLNQ